MIPVGTVNELHHYIKACITGDWSQEARIPEKEQQRVN